MAISFVFTYLIVVRPVDFFTNQKQNNNKVATQQDTGVQVRATYSTEDVFRPTRLVLTNKISTKWRVALQLWRKWTVT